jgi:hypothetical protein
MLASLQTPGSTVPSRPRVALVLLALLPLTLLVACGGGPPADSGAAGGEASTEGAAKVDDTIPPIRSQGDGAGPASAGKPGPVGFDLPEGWQDHPPTSSMRIAQARIPGDGGPAEMVVFYFGPGQGGGTQANLQRWIGQMQVAAGTQPEEDSFQVGDLTVTHVTVHGTLLPSGMGTGPTEPQPDSMLMGAVVEGPGGPWFFKVTGPEATLESQRDTFLEMLHTVRPPA